MAKTNGAAAKTEAKPTNYRLLRKLDLANIEAVEGSGEPAFDLAALGLTPEDEVYVLVTRTYTGNVKNQAAEEFGEGEYAQVAASSWQPFPVRLRQVVSFK